VGGGVVGLFLARACAEKGLRVCVVEKGGEADGLPDTYPPIRFSDRINHAVIEARNHIFGGNSRYWGGTLVEDDGALIEALGITDQNVAAFSRAGEAVYSKIGIRRTHRFDSHVKSNSSVVLCEFPVLTGKFRNIWSANSPQFLADGIQCFLNAELMSVESNRGKNTALFRNSAGEEKRIEFSSMVISAGVVDSIRMVSKLFPGLPQSANLLGKHMNDHLSLPVLSFPWRRSKLLDQLFPPRFDKDVKVGRRLEFTLPESGVKGFIHLQAPYDDVEPYRSLKRLVFAQQLGLSWKAKLSAFLSLSAGGITTLRVGVDRFLAHRLYYPQGGQVNIMVDIESDSESDKFINLSGDYVLNWRLSDSDIEHLREASLLALELLGREVLDDKALDEAREKVKATSFSKFSEIKCEEALHLGGGLQHVLSASPGLEIKCRLQTEVPAYVISTAIFPRGGVANPVHTLLVCSEMLSNHLSTKVS
jgi:hypothetical protein